MDTIRKPPRRSKFLLLLFALAVTAVAVAGGYYLRWPGALRVPADSLVIRTVVQEEFFEFINLDGRVEPASTYLIDSKIAGNVERIFATSGQVVQRGDTLLRIANADLELEVMQRESQLIEQLNAQRQTRLLLNQNDFTRRAQLIEIDYQLDLQTKQTTRNRQLLADGLIAPADFEPGENNYRYYQRRKQLLTTAFRADSNARARQLRQIDAFEERILSNLAAVRAILDRLYLRAAVTGRLSNFNVSAGQAITSGQRLGELYDLDEPLIVAEVDEFYLDKVTVGQEGILTGRGDSLRLVVARIYPTVSGGRFRIDARLTGGSTTAAGFVRGQAVRFRLRFGRERSAVLLANGEFYGTSGGRWVYRMSPDGARRTPVRLGRSNPNYYEVLEGLAVGDRVIVSDYAAFNEYDNLIIN